MRTSRRWLSGLILFPLASAAYGQGAAALQGASPLEDATEEIVVTGQRERGAVISDIKPEVRMTAGDVRAMGVSNISELLGEISPQTSGDRGRGGGAPVVLLNGLRISSFAEIRDLPTEAIARVDIFPEELALKYGYRADQKVVNIVLRGRFRAATTELEPTLATAGGRASAKAEAGLLRISAAGRTSLNAQYQHDTPLYETERDIVAPLPASGIDQRPFRTLLASGDQFALNGTINRPVKKNISATLNGRFQWDGGTSSLGAILPVGMTIPKPLVRKTDTISGHVGFALNGALAKWQWTLTSNYDINHAVSLTDRGQPQRDRARTTTRDFDTELVANGTLFKLPAGGVMASFKAGFESIGLDGRSTRSGIPQTTSLSRNNISGQASFDLPIASRKEAYLSGLGNLSANFNIAVDHLSDFGTLKTFGYGMTWSPVVPLELIASVTDQDGAPSSAQLGNPNLVTPNVQIFDFVRATTVNVSQLSGGNPALIADNRRVIKLGATLKPIRTLDLSITANYTNNRTRNVIASFPTVTPALEAAFPDRFVRAASGQLVSIDSRPVNFAAAERQQLRWGVNVSKRLGPPPKPGSFEALRGQSGDRPPEGATGARTDGNRGGVGGGGGGRGFGGRQPRLQLALYHTWHLRDSILIRDGLPLLDLLNGAAVGSAGGQPRHEVEAQAGFVKNGLGMRMTGTWQSATTVRGVPGSTGLTGGDLHFSDKATLGLRLFADLGLQRALTKDRPWLRGARISVSVDNLFDSKTRVRDAFGVTPINYQPAYLDPLGRTIRITLRKLFL